MAVSRYRGPGTTGEFRAFVMAAVAACALVCCVGALSVGPGPSGRRRLGHADTRTGRSASVLPAVPLDRSTTSVCNIFSAISRRCFCLIPQLDDDNPPPLLLDTRVDTHTLRAHANLPPNHDYTMLECSKHGRAAPRGNSIRQRISTATAGS